MAKQKIQQTTPKVAPIERKSTNNEPINFGKDEPILFNKSNYIIMMIGTALIILGFVLMAGGASDDPKVFDAAAVYSKTRITVAPITIVIGFIIIAIGILKKPSSQDA